MKNSISGNAFICLKDTYETYSIDGVSEVGKCFLFCFSSSEAIFTKHCGKKHQKPKYLGMLYIRCYGQLVKQAICGVTSKPKGSFNFQVMTIPFRV